MEKKANCMGKATAWMAGCANSMKRGVHNTRQEGIVADSQKQIRRLTFEMGKLTLIKLGSGEDVSVQVSELRLWTGLNATSSWGPSRSCSPGQCSS